MEVTTQTEKHVKWAAHPTVIDDDEEISEVEGRTTSKTKHVTKTLKFYPRRKWAQTEIEWSYAVPLETVTPPAVGVMTRSVQRVESSETDFHPDNDKPSSLSRSRNFYSLQELESDTPPRSSNIGRFHCLTFCPCLPQQQTESNGVWWKSVLKILHNYFAVYPLIIATVWALLYLFFGKHQATPGGSLFGVLVLVSGAILCGDVTEALKLPPLLGMLAAGLIHGNVPAISQLAAIPPSVLSPLRAIASAMLITRGAYLIDPAAIYKYRHVVPYLAYLSCAAGASAAATAIYVIVKFPPAWCALLGGIIAAMAGPVVMPFLAFLDSVKYEERSIALSIAKAACGLDAILSITIAECALGFVFSNGDISDGFAKGLGEVLIGGACGLLWGCLGGVLLGANNCVEIRTFVVFAGGVILQIGVTEIGYPRGGPPGVFVAALVTSILWRIKNIDEPNNEKVNLNLTKIWFLCQPLLFGILGSRTDLTTVDWSVLSKVTICLCVSLSIRILTAYAACRLVPGMSWRQKLFVAISLVPKGTLQAELAPVALDMTRRLNFGPEAESMGFQVMNISVLTIFLTSSIGSILLLLLGPRLLNKQA